MPLLDTSIWLGKSKKRGVLHRQLGVGIGSQIPHSLLREILNTDTGVTLRNYPGTGKSHVPVTKLLKSRARAYLEKQM
jgi:hypothetical protein